VWVDQQRGHIASNIEGPLRPGSEDRCKLRAIGCKQGKRMAVGER
jgi:hypothetical protein